MISRDSRHFARLAFFSYLVFTELLCYFAIAKAITGMKQAECIIFPDIHGRDFWKKVLINDCGWETERYIFLGDYFDPYDYEGITPKDAIDNWNELMMALTAYADKEIVFLIGNHDAHYIDATFRSIACGSRFSQIYCDKIQDLLRQVKLQVAYELMIAGKRILFTHAGLTYPWYQSHEDVIGALTVDGLNNLVKSDKGWRALSDVSYYRLGEAEYGSPLWADINEFANKNLVRLNYDFQIAGHNQLMDDHASAFGNVVDLDCHHPFALTSDLKIIKID